MICPTCHTRLKKACPACGRLLHLRWNICAYCGAVQTAAKAVPAPAEPVSLAVESGAAQFRLSELSASPGGALEAQHAAEARPEPRPRRDIPPQDESWPEPEAGAWAADQAAAEPEEIGATGATEDPEAENWANVGSRQEPATESPIPEEARPQAEAGEEDWVEPDAEPDQEDETETLSSVSE